MGERKTLHRLTIDRGDPLDIYLRVWDGPRGNGMLKGLTGYTGRMHIRPDADSDIILLAPLVTCGTFVQMDSRTGAAVTCNVHVSATAAQTAGLPDWGMGVFDIELIDTFGHPWTIVPGIALLRKDVTR